MSLRFPDPAQRDAIAAAARAEGVSLQEYILTAAYQCATGPEAQFRDGSREHDARTREVNATNSATSPLEGEAVIDAAGLADGSPLLPGTYEVSHFY
jgi:hypothetical protein